MTVFLENTKFLFEFCWELDCSSTIKSKNLRTTPATLGRLFIRYKYRMFFRYALEKVKFWSLCICNPSCQPLLNFLSSSIRSSCIYEDHKHLTVKLSEACDRDIILIQRDLLKWFGFKRRLKKPLFDFK